jgi:hypothetical protein
VPRAGVACSDAECDGRRARCLTFRLRVGAVHVDDRHVEGYGEIGERERGESEVQPRGRLQARRCSLMISTGIGMRNGTCMCVMTVVAE